MLDQLDGVVRHLLRKFARRAQDQGAGRGGLEMARIGRVLALGALRSRFAFGSSLGSRALVSRALFFGGLGLLLEQGVQHRQQEGGGLAATGLAGDHQVDVALGFARGAGGHGQGDGTLLHGGGLGVAQIGHGLHQFGRQAQLHEAVGHGFGHYGLDRHGGLGGKNGFGRRKVARHFKSVGHLDFSHTRTPQDLRVLR